MTLRSKIQALIDDPVSRITASGIAKAIGKSPSTVSQWLGGKYKGDVEQINGLMQAYLARHQERESFRGVRVPFVEITNSMIISEVARLCHLYGEIGVITGEAGLGKTVAAEDYARRNGDVILIQTHPCYTAKFLFAEIADQLGLPRTNINQMFPDIAQRLQDSGRMIIVDEAENLPFPALELLRRLYDQTGIGVLLLGEPVLIKLLRGSHGQFARLYSRVRIHRELKPLSSEDVQRIVSAALPGTNGLWKAFAREAHKNGRRLNMLIKEAGRIATLNSISIDEDVVSEAAQVLIK